MTASTADEKKTLTAVDVVTPEFRASYPSLFEAKAPDPKKPTEKIYGVEMWFRVRDTPESLAAGEKVVSIAALEAAATAACEAAWGADKSKWPAKFKHPFKKGDELTGKNGAVPGCIVVRAQRKEEYGKPQVVMQDPTQPCIDVKAIYAGSYCRAKIHAYTWKHPTGGCGVSFNLDMVQFVRDGEPLGNRLRANDVFDSIPVPGATPAAKTPAAATSTPAPTGSVFGGLS